MTARTEPTRRPNLTVSGQVTAQVVPCVVGAERLFPFCCQLSYPAVVQSAFGLFSCYTLVDGSSTFFLAPHLDCASDEARIARAVGVASLVIWGVGFPIFLGLLIIRKANDPKYSFVIVSYGYKSALRYWAALECLKKFGVLLIITVLNDTSRFSQELAATILVLFLAFAAIAVAVSEPFVSSLVNNLHVACDFLAIFVLLTGLLSTSVGQTDKYKTGEVETMSIVVVSYAACLLAGLLGILAIETGSVLRPGSRLHALWQSFLHSSAANTVKSAAHRASFVTKRLSSYSTVVPSAPSFEEALDRAAADAEIVTE